MIAMPRIDEAAIGRQARGLHYADFVGNRSDRERVHGVPRAAATNLSLRSSIKHVEIAIYIFLSELVGSQNVRRGQIPPCPLQKFSRPDERRDSGRARRVVEAGTAQMRVLNTNTRYLSDLLTE